MCTFEGVVLQIKRDQNVCLSADYCLLEVPKSLSLFLNFKQVRNSLLSKNCLKQKQKQKNAKSSLETDR